MTAYCRCMKGPTIVIQPCMFCTQSIQYGKDQKTLLRHDPQSNWGAGTRERKNHGGEAHQVQKERGGGCLALRRCYQPAIIAAEAASDLRLCAGHMFTPLCLVGAAGSLMGSTFALLHGCSLAHIFSLVCSTPMQIALIRSHHYRALQGALCFATKSPEVNSITPANGRCKMQLYL